MPLQPCAATSSADATRTSGLPHQSVPLRRSMGLPVQLPENPREIRLKSCPRELARMIRCSFAPDRVSGVRHLSLDVRADLGPFRAPVFVHPRRPVMVPAASGHVHLARHHDTGTHPLPGRAAARAHPEGVPCVRRRQDEAEEIGYAAVSPERPNLPKRGSLAVCSHRLGDRQRQESPERRGALFRTASEKIARYGRPCDQRQPVKAPAKPSSGASLSSDFAGSGRPAVWMQPIQRSTLH